MTTNGLMPGEAVDKSGPPALNTRVALTEEEAAAALAISARQVWQLRKDGELPSFFIGRSVRIAVKDLEAFVDRQRAKKHEGEGDNGQHQQ